MVIVDTSVWIQALRVHASPERSEIDSLLESNTLVMVGPVLAEVLQGARTTREFEELRDQFVALPYLQESSQTWVMAGALSHQLRQRGKSVPLMDLLIAALALEHKHQVYTRDEHIRGISGLSLYSPESVRR